MRQLGLQRNFQSSNKEIFLDEGQFVSYDDYNIFQDNLLIPDFIEMRIQGYSDEIIIGQR